MRCFDFKAKNIGDSERYLTYVMGEGVELDEDTLDILEDGDIPGLVKVIYEEDDDFDYLTYDVSGMTNLAAFTEGEVDKETVLKIVRNISLSIIALKERAIHLAYLVLNKGFMFVDKRTLDVTFLCVPVESEAFVMKEFKSFLKYFIAGLKFNIGEDVSYVGQILTYVNGDAFNLRGLIGLTEALMQDAGISFEESDEAIATDEGTEVLDSYAAETTGVKDFMKDLGEAPESLPEISAEDDDEMEAIEAAAENEGGVLDIEIEDEEPAAEAAENAPAEEEAVQEEEAPEDEAPEEDALPDEVIATKLKELVMGTEGDEPEGPVKEEAAEPVKPAGIKKPAVKVSRAALIQQAAEEAAAAAEAEAAAEAAEAVEAAPAETEVPVAEGVTEISSKSKVEKTKTVEAPVQEKPVKESKKAKKAEAAAMTEELAPKPAAPVLKTNPYIVRVDNEEKIIIQKAVFKIGKASRGVDYHVSDNGAISRQHAVITKKDDGYYIRDNKSTNHTYVDGRELEEGEEVLLKNNTKFKLADEEFIFKW